MKKSNKNLILFVSVLCILGFMGPVAALAATAPTLGALSTYGVVSTTYTNTAAGTTIKGGVCYTTGPATTPTITGATVVPCPSALGTLQTNAVATINGQSCTTISGALNDVIIGANPAGTFPPGCYTMAGAMNITLSKNVTLKGTGVYIFRSGAALTTGADSSIILTNGATADKVYWAPVGATTLGANTVFVGNILDAAGITLGNSATLLGRALAFQELVKTTLTNTITVPATLHVIKVVSGAAAPADFTVNVKTVGGADVSGSPLAGAVAPGTAYSLAAGTYVVSEVADPAYTRTFSGACNSSGNVILAAGEDKTCTITNTSISLPVPATLSIEKTVVGGTASASDFTINVKTAGGGHVSGSPALGAVTPGTSYSLAAGTYTVSEDADASYTTVFGGACGLNGVVTLAAADDVFCTVVNTSNAVLPLTRGGGYYNDPLPLINLTKIPNPLVLPNGAGPVTYTYTATNIGKVAMRGVWVKDDKCAPLALVSGDTNNDLMLDLDESWVYTCSKTLAETETNTATAHGNANGWDGYDIANTTVVVGKSIIPPLIHVVKKPDIFVLPAGGGDVTYTYTVTNPGTEPLNNVSITDNKCTGLPGRVIGHPGDLNKNNLLEHNESWTFTCKTKLTETTTNIGMAVGHANGLVATDLSPATVAVSAPSLPNTGLPSEPWDTVVLALSASLLLVSASLVLVLRKSKV